MKYDKPNRYLKSTWAFMFVMCILLASALMVANCFALDVVDTPTITTPQSCYMESVIETGEEHSAIIHNGEYVPGIGTTTFHTYCNDFNGYAIYAIGYSGDTNGNTKMLHETTSTFDFDTGVATSGADSNWAMMLTAANGTYRPTIHSDTSGTYSSYHVVPSQFTKVVSYGSSTDLPPAGGTAEGSSFTSTYAVWVSSSQNAGSYTGKVRYVLVHPTNAPAPSGS
ncbi:hypothetical protein IKE98_03080 [Candidatus Saccharibacteria bacterium]|nr:hypothetical protein [Candidatus Saccharibacteria bacterium]